MFSRFFIDRPIFATVISILIILVGAITIPIMPIEKTPDITPPTVNVSTTYPGANAEVVAETVATPLEEEINGVEGMIYMSSKSSDDGQMGLTVTFEVGTDIDMATILVQNRVSMAEAKLPEEVRRQGVITRKRSSNMNMVISMISPESTYDQVFISNYITTRIKDRLARIPGIGNITVFGAKDFSMRVWIDPQQLKARGLTTSEVIGAIREQNIQVAAGQIGMPPAKSDLQFQYTVKTLGRLSSIEEFRDIILKTSDDGRILRLSDIADIELGSQSYTSNAHYDGSPTVAIGVFQLPGANALDVSKKIRKAMDEMSETFPKDLAYKVAYDPTLFISESIKEVLITLSIAVVLVILTVYIFLENVRATIIPAVTIPVSLIGTFAVMQLMGFSINTLSLFGLVLAIGIVVDDAIVVVENTMRIMEEEKLDSKSAVKKGMTQITGPVIATTLVLLAVFVPTGLIGGITGRLYSQFALTISTATIFSTINALTLSPALCGLFLRNATHTRGFFRFFDDFMKQATTSYTLTVKSLIRRTVIVMVLFLVMIASTFFCFKITPKGFLPTEDEGFLIVNLRLPDGATLDRTQEVVDKVSGMLENTPGVADYVSITGFSIIDSLNITNGGVFFVKLEPWDQRETSELSAASICGNIQMQLFTIKEAFGLCLQLPPIHGLGYSDGFELQLQDRGGAGYANLEKVANELVYNANQSDELTKLNSTFRANIPQIYLDIDRTKAKTLGVPLSDVFNTLQSSLGSYYVNDFNIFEKTYQVKIQAGQDFRNRVKDIELLEVRNDKGKMVPLSTLLKVEDTVGPQSILHYNMYPSTTVSGSPKPGFSTGQAMDKIKSLIDQTVPSNMGFEWSGMSFQQIQAGNKAPIIFALASIFVFLFLAAQYESWSIPFAIILSIPIAIFGGIAFTWVRAYDNNIYTQIGFVLLIALASKTSILLVEFAKQLHEEGKTVFEAAVEAARLRFRPILMTALSFVFGVIPLVVASGAGAASRRALGTTVFGGMLIATILGVFTIPVFYVFIQRIADWFTKPPKSDYEKAMENNYKSH